MKKKLIGLLAGLCILISAEAQNALVDRVANEACSCIGEQELNTEMSYSDAENLIAQCMAPSIMEHMDELMKVFKLKEFNQESGYQIGMEIGKRLAVVCPKFIELSLIMANNYPQEEANEDYTGEEEGSSDGEEYVDEEPSFIVGRYVREEGAAQRYIVLNVEGIEQRFLWLYWFDGADDIQADPSFYLNREVYIQYVSIDLYNGITKQYVSTPVLLSILSNE